MQGKIENKFRNMTFYVYYILHKIITCFKAIRKVKICKYLVEIMC